MNSVSIGNSLLINKVAESLSSMIKGCCGVTVGGSRMHNLEDDRSDVEMYFYSLDYQPNLSDIERCLLLLNAKHKRSSSFLWNNNPWGPHSFFVIDDVYFEVGYRTILESQNKLKEYLFNGSVMPMPDCHDLGLGYMLSGFASSVVHEKPLLLGKELVELKRLAALFPDILKQNIMKEYFDTAQDLYHGKLLVASQRKDIAFYDTLVNRIMRALFIVAFAISEEHFPGDKWNEVLLLRTAWKKAPCFIELFKEHAKIGSCESSLDTKYHIVGRMISLLLNEVSSVN